MKKVILSFPIEWGKEEVKELSFKRPKARHIKKLQLTGDMEMETLLDIAKKVVDHESPSIVDEVDACDAIKVAEVIGGFLGHGREIGENQ